MTGWLIFGGIVLLLVLLFTRSATVTAEYDQGKTDVKIRFLFLTLYPQKPKKAKSSEKKKRGAEKAETETTDESDKKESEKQEQRSAVPDSDTDTGSAKKRPKKASSKKEKKFAFDLAQIMDYVRSASPPVKRLFKKIRISDLYVDYVVATDDAAKTAIRYGAVCAALYPAVEWLTAYFTVRVQRINVEADFSEETDDIYAYAKIKLRVSTALGCVLWLGIRMLKTYFKYQKQQEAQA